MSDPWLCTSPMCLHWNAQAGQEPKLDANAFDNLQSMKDRQTAAAAGKTEGNGGAAPVSQEEEARV